MTEEASSRIPEVRPMELAERLNKREPILLLDVREPPERSFCRIEVSEPSVDLAIPLSELTSRLDEVFDAARGGRTVLVYCHHGVRSLMTARWLSQKGLQRVENLTSGIDGWSVEVDPRVPRY